MESHSKFTEHGSGHFGLPASVHLADPSNFSINPDDKGMLCDTEIRHSPGVPEVTHGALVGGGFQGWYRLMEKLFDCIQLPRLTLALINSTR